MVRAFISSAPDNINWRMMLWPMLAIIAAFAVSTPIRADSWSPPSTQIFVSADQKSRVTITPRDLDSSLEYFRDKVKDKAKPGLPKNAQNRQASAVVEVISDAGEWKFGWKVDLINEISPVSAILSDDGRHLVTFDNWHVVGYGPSTIVQYNREEGFIRQFDLGYFLPPYYLEALPTSVSSRSWKHGEGTIEDNILHFDIIVPAKGFRPGKKKPETVGFQIDLNSGHVSKEDTRAWIDALFSALEVQKSQLEYETQRIKQLIQPLTAKAQMSERDWHGYLREAYWRLIDANGSSATKHLRPLDHKEYQKSVQWINDEFAEMAENANEEDWLLSDVSIASSNQENLVKMLSDIANRAKSNDFRWGRVLIVMEERHWPQLEKAFAHTGIILHFVDPKVPVAPSLDRLKRIFNPDPQKYDGFLDGL